MIRSVIHVLIKECIFQEDKYISVINKLKGIRILSPVSEYRLTINYWMILYQLARAEFRNCQTKWETQFSYD